MMPFKVFTGSTLATHCLMKDKLGVVDQYMQ